MTSQPPLSRVTFDRAAPRRTQPQWLEQQWEQARILVLSPDAQTLAIAAEQGHRTAWHSATWFAELSNEVTITRRFLGILGDTVIFSATVADAAGGVAAIPVNPGQLWSSLREIGASGDELEASLLATAVGLQQWHHRHPRCPLCGGATEESAAGWTRSCPQDQSTHFPRTDPAVIMLVHDGGDRALLGRGANWGPGRFSTLAGFVEPGESLEAAVAREVWEEVGVHVEDIRYVASQPWPFPASLMVGFTAKVVGSEHIEADGEEMLEAGWFTRAEIRQAGSWTDAPASEPVHGESRLRQIPPQFSISRFLIDGWLNS